MGTKHEFVTNKAIWQHVQNALNSGKPARIAVPFIGMGASKWIKPAADSWLVTRCDLKSARAGQVSGKDLLAWHKKGVRIFNLQALHAKVFAFQDSAFIGSSNASVTSRDRLIEAGIWTSDKALAAAAREFVEGHCAEEVDEAFLKKLEKAYRPPTLYPMHGDDGSASSGTSKQKDSTRAQDEACMHLLRIYPVKWSDAEQRAADDAQVAGRKRVEPKLKVVLDAFTYPGEPGRFKVGDLVLIRMSDKKGGSETVQPWARIVGVAKVRGKKKQAVAIARLPAFQDKELSEFTIDAGDLMANFLKDGGRSRTATPEERAKVLEVWSHRNSKRLSSTSKASPD